MISGRRGDLRSYSTHLARYVCGYERFRIIRLDEPFAANVKVVTEYTLEVKKRNRETGEMAVIAIWRLEGGKARSRHRRGAAAVAIE